jgi:PAS domain S-box-containing protein
MASMDHFKQIVDTAPDAMVVVNAAGRIEYANLETGRLFGHPCDELVGKPYDILMPERFRAAHAGHMERFLAQPKARPMGAGMDLVGVTADGREIAIEVSLGVLRTAEGTLVLAAIRDIAERKRAQEALLASETRYRELLGRLGAALEAMTDPICILDPEEKIVSYNSAYLRFHGAEGPLHGRSRREMMAALLPRLAGDEEENRRSYEVFSKVRDGTREMWFRDGRKLRLTIRPMPDGGAVGHFADVTEDMHAAELLRQAQRTAEAASAAKSDFLSSMSHELRTPFNAILGFAQLLQRDRREPLSQRQRERVEQILKGADHLLRLVDDVLDLSRIEAGKVSISMEPVSVSDVLDDVIAGLRPAAERAHVRVERGAVPDGLRCVQADRTRLAQILVNYGTNAVKYNRPGGTLRFDVSAPGPSRVRLSVTDTGLGIPVDKQGSIFEPFQRAGQEAGPIEGTGIGLAISKHLAELMRGVVGFRSASGEGSEFWVDLMADESGATPGAPSSPGEAKPSSLAGVPCAVVLYIEDNPANIALMRDLFGGYPEVELATAATAELGLEIARARQPKVILMDINLPGMSGLDAMQVLRAWPETRDIPVVALTAAARERDRQIGKAAGFYRYLAKPVKIDELEAALEELLGTGTPAF